jgi:hypothetical protein
MKRLSAPVVLIVGLLIVANPGLAEEKAATSVPRVQVALLLDTSNSMDGLINQARTQLWRIVNEFANLKLAGKTPALEVALYEYGNDGLPAAEGFIRLVVPFTSDLDKISEALFALKTYGGQEFCGRVIDCATRQLTWSTGPRDLRAIFIAGNEPFTQGDFDYRKACQAAAAKAVTVSTIFCGPREEGIQTSWEQGAKLADGSYLNIDQNQVAVDLPAPQDKDLAKLSEELNRTYLAYGDAKARKEAASRQVAQDANAAQSAVSSAASRAGFKASNLYRNAGWDLIDAVQEGKVKLDDLTVEQLPEELQKLPPADRKTLVEKKMQERQAIQTKIQTLSADRNTYLAGQRRLVAEQTARARVQAAAAAPGAPAPAAASAASFDAAVIEAVQRQATGR